MALALQHLAFADDHQGTYTEAEASLIAQALLGVGTARARTDPEAAAADLLAVADEVLARGGRLRLSD